MQQHRQQRLSASTWLLIVQPCRQVQQRTAQALEQARHSSPAMQPQPGAQACALWQPQQRSAHKQSGRQRTRYRLPWLRRSFRYSASASTFTAAGGGGR